MDLSQLDRCPLLNDIFILANIVVRPHPSEKQNLQFLFFYVGLIEIFPVQSVFD